MIPFFFVSMKNVESIEHSEKLEIRSKLFERRLVGLFGSVAKSWAMEIFVLTELGKSGFFGRTKGLSTWSDPEKAPESRSSRDSFPELLYDFGETACVFSGRNSFLLADFRGIFNFGGWFSAVIVFERRIFFTRLSGRLKAGRTELSDFSKILNKPSILTRVDTDWSYYKLRKIFR